MNKPKRQHFLPRFCLNNFGFFEDGKNFIYLYRRGGSEPIRVSTRDAGKGNDIYTYTDEKGERNYSIETELFQTLDGGLAPLLKKINAPLSPIQIKPVLMLWYGEILDVSNFVAYQMVRTPASIQQCQDMTAGLMKEVMKRLASHKAGYEQSIKRAVKEGKEPEMVAWTPEEIEKTRQYFVKGEYSIETGGQYYLGQSLGLAQKMLAGIMMKKMTILKAPKESFFLTSDYPVIKIPDVKAPPLYQRGILGSHVYFPISSTTAIFFENDEEPRGPKPLNCVENIDVKEIASGTVKGFNDRMIYHAEEEVYAGVSDKNIQTKINATTKPKRFSVGVLPRLAHTTSAKP